MSNVLIGIIGVILFIGLALAGALFLGPRFQEASANSEAARVMANLKQISDAVNMMASNEGVKLMEYEQGLLVSGGYLKALPKNTFAGTDVSVYAYQLSNGPYTVGVGRGFPAEYVAVYLYTQNTADNPRMLKICEAISRQAGQATLSNTGPSGCYATGSAYAAFMKI